MHLTTQSPCSTILSGTCSPGLQILRTVLCIDVVYAFGLTEGWLFSPALLEVIRSSFMIIYSWINRHQRAGKCRPETPPYMSTNSWSANIFKTSREASPHAEPIGKPQWDNFSNFIEQANEYCTTPV